MTYPDSPNNHQNNMYPQNPAPNNGANPYAAGENPFADAGNPYASPPQPVYDPMNDPNIYPPAQYGQSQNPYWQQPYMMQPMQSVPDNNMVWCILSTLFSVLLCSPFALLGGIGIYFSTQVDKRWRMGYQNEAVDAAKKAKLFAILGVAVPLVLTIMYLMVYLILDIQEVSDIGEY